MKEFNFCDLCHKGNILCLLCYVSGRGTKSYPVTGLGHGIVAFTTLALVQCPKRTFDEQTMRLLAGILICTEHMKQDDLEPDLERWLSGREEVEHQRRMGATTQNSVVEQHLLHQIRTLAIEIRGLENENKRLKETIEKFDRRSEPVVPSTAKEVICIDDDETSEDDTLVLRRKELERIGTTNSQRSLSDSLQNTRKRATTSGTEPLQRFKRSRGQSVPEYVAINNENTPTSLTEPKNDLDQVEKLNTNVPTPCPYRCDPNLLYTSRVDLAIHLLRHHDVHLFRRPCPCPHGCDPTYLYEQSETLKMHIRLEHDELLMPCPRGCNPATLYRTVGDLKRHLQSHGDKQHLCFQGCGATKLFESEEERDEHYRAYHNAFPTGCLVPWCNNGGRLYANRGSYTKHLRSIHGISKLNWDAYIPKSPYELAEEENRMMGLKP